MLNELICLFFGHNWKRVRRRRACCRCHAREVLYFQGYSFGRWRESWIEHKYPINADPAKDPTEIQVDGYSYTLGQLHEFKEVMKS